MLCMALLRDSVLPHRCMTLGLCVVWQLNSLGQKLQDIVEQRRQPGHPRPEEEIYLSKLSTDADKLVSTGIRAEVRQAALKLF